MRPASSRRTAIGAVDLNNIPIALLDRVDVLTGGASTTYGADAVTGVVNFITKKNFAGMDLQISNGISERGDGHNFRADLTLGANFDDGRGNAVLAVGYIETDPMFFGDRAIRAMRDQLDHRRLRGRLGDLDADRVPVHGRSVYADRARR